MKNVALLLGSTGQVLALDSGKVAELLQVFKSNQAKYQVNVEQYCRFGDLPIMEFTEYQCTNVIEESLTDGKTCAFACKHDASITGSVECVCDNPTGEVTQNSVCRWKFPNDYSSICGPSQISVLSNSISSLETENQDKASKIDSLEVYIQSVEGTIDGVQDQVVDVDAKVATKHAEALAEISAASGTHETARAALEADLKNSIAQLEVDDASHLALITSQGNTLGDVVALTDAHADTLQAQEQKQTSLEQLLASQAIDILTVQNDLETETGSLLASLNNQILKQENEMTAVETEVSDNYAHWGGITDTLDTAIIATKDDLASEVARGGVRDAQLAAHDVKFGDVENDIQTNQDMILSTNDELNSKFLFLANYTDQAVDNIDNHLTAEMDTLEQEQNNANLVLEAEDEKLAVSLNQTQTALDTEEARGDAQDTRLDGHDADIVQVNTDIASNVAAINTVQGNLDHEVEVLTVSLNLTETKLQGEIDDVEAAMQMADVLLQQNIDATNDLLADTRTELDAEEARGVARDARLDGHDADVAQINQDITDTNIRIDDTITMMIANDSALRQNIDDNFNSLTASREALATELRAAEAALSATDDQIKSDLNDTNIALDAEVARGQGRDVVLDQHHGRLVFIEGDLIDKQEQIDNLTDTVAWNHADVITRIATTKQELEHEIEHVRDDLDATNVALGVERSRNDGHDTVLAAHDTKLIQHDWELNKLDTDIKQVQTNLDDAVVAIGQTIDATRNELLGEIADLEADMIKADQALTDETERLQDELDKTNKNLDDEVTRGQLRDATLNDHNVRITVLRNDVDKNTADLVTTNEELDQKTQKLTDDLRNTTDTLNDRIYETDRRLTQADADLRQTDLQIRSEMAAQKFALETKINQDILTTDTALRTRYDNEIYRIDTKFTNSINGLAQKQQNDVDEIHAALDLVWGIYRPAEMTLIGPSAFQPEPGHLLTIIPYFYRIWSISVEIMPYKKNKMEWVNLLHFTASGDNYGRPGDRHPLVSFYPGENLLHIACYLNNEVSYAYDSNYVLPMHQWTKLTLGQSWVQGQYVYYVMINGKQVFSQVNYYPMDFQNMMVYASDPWTSRPNAKLRNLVYGTSWGTGGLISRTVHDSYAHGGAKSHADGRSLGEAPEDVAEE